MPTPGQGQNKNQHSPHLSDFSFTETFVWGKHPKRALLTGWKPTNNQLRGFFSIIHWNEYVFIFGNLRHWQSTLVAANNENFVKMTFPFHGWLSSILIEHAYYKPLRVWPGLIRTNYANVITIDVLAFCITRMISNRVFDGIRHASLFSMRLWQSGNG